MSRASPANAITWKNLSPVSQDPGTAIPRSRPIRAGSVEKDLLNKLNIIPYLDLETLGCPKYEQLKEAIVEP